MSYIQICWSGVVLIAIEFLLQKLETQPANLVQSVSSCSLDDVCDCISNNLRWFVIDGACWAPGCSCDGVGKVGGAYTSCGYLISKVV